MEDGSTVAYLITAECLLTGASAFDWENSCDTQLSALDTSTSPAVQHICLTGLLPTAVHDIFLMLHIQTITKNSSAAFYESSFCLNRNANDEETLNPEEGHNASWQPNRTEHFLYYCIGLPYSCVPEMAKMRVAHVIFDASCKLSLKNNIPLIAILFTG